MITIIFLILAAIAVLFLTFYLLDIVSEFTDDNCPWAAFPAGLLILMAGIFGIAFLLVKALSH